MVIWSQKQKDIEVAGLCSILFLKKERNQMKLAKQKATALLWKLFPLFVLHCIV